MVDSDWVDVEEALQEDLDKAFELMAEFPRVSRWRMKCYLSKKIRELELSKIKKSEDS